MLLMGWPALGCPWTHPTSRTTCPVSNHQQPVFLPVHWQAREQLPTPKSTPGAPVLLSSQGPSVLGLPQASGVLHSRDSQPRAHHPHVLPAPWSPHAPPLLQSLPPSPYSPILSLLSSHPLHPMGSLGSPNISPVTPATPSSPTCTPSSGPVHYTS